MNKCETKLLMTKKMTSLDREMTGKYWASALNTKNKSCDGAVSTMT